MYKVIEYFTDLHDNDHEYHEGDIFPREGIKVTEERLKELSGPDNKRGMPLIEKAEEKPEEKPEKNPGKKRAAKEAAETPVKR